MAINMIVAAGLDGAIGQNGKLIWELPGDLKRFKELTTGHAVIMGRKTWDSLPKKPLPGRLNIVMSQDENFKPEGAVVARSQEEALKAAGDNEIFIIGGEIIYNMFLGIADRIYLTLVEDICPEADAHFPVDLNHPKWNITDKGVRLKNNEGKGFSYITLDRKPVKEI